MIDKRLDHVLEDASFVQLSKYIREMFMYHGYKVDDVTMQPGLFYDTANWEVDFTKDGNAYTINTTQKFLELDKAPKRIEGLLLDMIANNKL